MRGRLSIPVAVTAAIALAAPALASATTRSEFVAQSEALCATTNKAINATSHRLFRKYKRLRPQGHFSELKGRQKRRDDSLFYGGYGRVLTFQGLAIHALDAQLQLVPAPADDRPLIAQWIESRRVDADLIKEAGQQIVRVSKRKPGYVSRFIFKTDSIDDQLGLTDLIVGSYGFDQCFLAPDDSF
jgi:hypothetical protein